MTTIPTLCRTNYASNNDGDDPAECFLPKGTGLREKVMIARMQKAAAIMQFKLEGQTIERNPQMNMEHRRLLHHIDHTAGTIEIDGATTHERAIADEVRKVLGLPGLGVQVTAVRVPMFFGAAASVVIELERPLGRERAAALLRESPGLFVHNDTEPAGLPTPADVVGSQATHVGRVRDDPSAPNGLALWFAFDSIEKGAALNAVQIGEIVMRRQA
jgi:aspartate-semialdehyde dehydrogenase